jgi:hypothetical protein
VGEDSVPAPDRGSFSAVQAGAVPAVADLLGRSCWSAKPGYPALRDGRAADAYPSGTGPGYHLAREGSVEAGGAKDMVLGLMLAEQPEAARSLMVSSVSPDADPGKFIIAGKAARAIHRYNGWQVPIQPGLVRGRIRPAHDPPDALSLVCVRHPAPGC